MKQKLRNIGSSPIARNLVSVGFIQGLAMLLPLLTIPYLITTVGPSGFALINVALAIVTYFVVLTDYGFNLMGTRLIALNKHRPSELNRIFSTMLYAQLLLTLIAILLFALIVFAVPAYRQEALFFAATFGIVLGSTLLPTWYFQGVEKFNQLHLITLAYRGAYTLGIFLFVNEAEDLIKVPVLNSLTHLAGGLFGLVWIMQKYQVRFTSWNWKEIVQFLREGFNLFVSAVSVTSLQQMPIIILSFFASATVVGFYAFADKILLLFRVVIQLFGSILYPRVIAASQKSYAKVKELLSSIRWAGSFAMLAIAIGLFFLPDLLASFFPSYYNPSLEVILKIWSLLPLALFLKIIAQQVLLAYDFTRYFARIMVAGALLNVLILSLLSAWLGHTGTALAVLVTEVFLIFALQAGVVKNASNPR